ncbi:MAG: hypothetical protein H7Y11_04020, partial [Armatimonadetes bacterium]|nr:hypothetical protein [Anaerolineae bacterium]
MTNRWQSFDQFISTALETPLEARQALVNGLLRERPNFPWVQGRQATFIYARPGARNVAVNLDTIKADPPFAPMQNLAGTSLWYVSLTFAVDDLLDYLIAVNDPMTPLAQEPNIVARVNQYWQSDPYNPLRITTAQKSVSVLRMGEARPFPDWAKLQRVPKGSVYEHSINSTQLKFTGRKVWVYTPPGYDEHPNQDYPLLILNDGQWAVGPMQVPNIADALIKHGQMRPVIIAMMQSGDQNARLNAYVGNDRQYFFTLTELLPFVQSQYRVDSDMLGVGGVGISAIAAAHTALKNPIFTQLMMVSPPLAKGDDDALLPQYTNRFENVRTVPQRIFQSVGRYEAKG